MENIYALITSFFLPVLYIVIGIIMLVRPPKYHNMAYGYRSKRSLASEKAWSYAQRACATALLICGAVTAAITLCFMSLPSEKLVMILLFANCGAIILCIPVIEYLLKRKFGK